LNATTAAAGATNAFIKLKNLANGSPRTGIISTTLPREVKVNINATAASKNELTSFLPIFKIPTTIPRKSNKYIGQVASAPNMAIKIAKTKPIINAHPPTLSSAFF